MQTGGTLSAPQLAESKTLAVEEDEDYVGQDTGGVGADEEDNTFAPATTAAHSYKEKFADCSTLII